MCPLFSFLAAECQPFSSTDGLGNSLTAGNEHVSATEGVCVCAHTCGLLGWRTRSVCGVAVGADRAGVPFLPADFQPFSTTEGLVCVVAPAPAAAAAGPCHCAVGHAVHVFHAGSAAQSAGSRRGERGAGDWDGGFVSTRDFAALF